MKKSEKILKDNMAVLHRLSNVLLEREILDSDEIDKVMRGIALPPAEKALDLAAARPDQEMTR
jgi:cell division protease FtsH